MNTSDLPESHPRYQSLASRDEIVRGVDAGITSIHGLLAHGRGEAFDYLLGEETHIFARNAIDAAAAYLLLAERPVISVNGNAAALTPRSLVALAVGIPAALEVNIFHASSQRERAIASHLRKNGARKVLLPKPSHDIGVESNRGRVHPEGILQADTVLVPLEDGDRCEALRQAGKSVLTIDLNPSSRTALSASVTIVDNIVRALPLLIDCLQKMKILPRSRLMSLLSGYDNQETLREARRQIVSGFVSRK